MLSLNKLEKVIELEEQLRSEYQSQLDSKAEEIDSLIRKQAELQATIETRQATIDQQLATITELSGKATANQRTEQLNRELTNRTDKLQDEVAELKKRVKILQKDLAEERAENKTLKQFDPARMKKNLDAGKKKLAEKTRAAEVLQKSLNASKSENAELQSKLKELEARLAELEPGQDDEEAAA
jgi:chromosome segregation ATPase